MKLGAFKLRVNCISTCTAPPTEEVEALLQRARARAVRLAQHRPHALHRPLSSVVVVVVVVVVERASTRAVEERRVSHAPVEMRVKLYPAVAAQVALESIIFNHEIAL